MNFEESQQPYVPFDPKEETLCYVKVRVRSAKGDFSYLRYPGVIIDPNAAAGILVEIERPKKTGGKILELFFAQSYMLERRTVETNREQGV